MLVCNRGEDKPRHGEGIRTAQISRETPVK
jgi:hypothetical protein